MTSALYMAESWRLPGCNDNCRPRRHDPLAHEQYGRRMGRIATADIVRTGPLAVDLVAERLTVAGAYVHVTPNEWYVLAVLASNLGLVVDHDTILASVWGEAYRSSHHLLRVNVTRLRQRLGVAGGLIVAVVARGYRLEECAPEGPMPMPMPPPQRWARDWDACQWCHSTDRAHASRGLCTACRVRQQRTGKFI